tara:strand:+ start:159 stop:461 length:303 start_codon:yes stop_codon:yes gene_type:complete
VPPTEGATAERAQDFPLEMGPRKRSLHPKSRPRSDQGVPNQNDGLDGRGLHLLQMLSKDILPRHSAVRQVHNKTKAAGKNIVEQRCALHRRDINVLGLEV